MLSFLFLVMPVPSCAPHPAEPARAAGTLPWRGNETDAYRRGHKDGSGDQRAGRASSPRAGEGADYRSGYQDGYRYPHDNPWSRRRAYQLGYQHGRRDKASGHGERPARDAGAVPSAVGDEYLRGYRAGLE